MIPWRHLRLDLVVLELAVLDFAAVSEPTETWSRIDSITPLLTPALARSSTLEYGRPATIFFAVAGPTPQRFSSRLTFTCSVQVEEDLGGTGLGLRCTFWGGGLAVDHGAHARDGKTREWDGHKPREGRAKHRVPGTPHQISAILFGQILMAT